MGVKRAEEYVPRAGGLGFAVLRHWSMVCFALFRFQGAVAAGVADADVSGKTLAFT